MTKAWTVHGWVSSPGRDKEFVVAWKEFAEWMVRQKGSTRMARLFRDTSDPRHFMSVDAWEDEKMLEAFREGPEFKGRLKLVRRFLDDYILWPLVLEAETKG